MKKIVVCVKKPREREERFEIEDVRVLVGSGAHCDIRLPIDAAYEHVVLTQEGDAVVARPALRELTMLVDGERSTERELSAGNVVTVEGSTIEILSLDEIREESKKSSPLRHVAVGLATLLVVFGFALASSAGTSQTALAPPPPDPAPIPKTALCPETDRALAGELARQKLTQAADRQQRFRFHAGDGPESVRLYTFAGACFAASGDEGAAADARLRGERMQAVIVEQFRVARVRLDRALTDGRAVQALQQIEFMRALLGTREDTRAYVEWLIVLQSKVETALATAK